MAPLPRTGHRLRARLDFQPRLRAARTASRGPSMPEPSTSTGALARLGFSRSERVRRFLAEPALSELGDRAPSALGATADGDDRSEEHTSELQSRGHLVCRLLLEKKKQMMPMINW